jgi:hypothetical protein
VPLRFALQIVERRSPRVECDGTLNPEEVVRLLFCLLHTAYSILRTAYYVLTPAFPISPAFPATPALLAFFLTIWYHEVRILLYRGDTTMGNHVNGTGDDRFMILENKAAQVRKLLFGSLLLAKDIWQEELFNTPEGLDIMRTMEEAEEEFIAPSLTDPVERLDRALSVINTRARAFVMLLDYLARLKQG